MISGSRVAVVGGAGFLGSHLVDYLLQNDCQVLVIDNLCAGRREFVTSNVSFVHHDITGSEEFLTRLFRARGVQYVFNYAAWPYIPDSFSRPLHVFNVNAMGAIKVINAAHEAGCQGILQVSSAEIYGEATGKTTEEGRILPHSTYGSAKAAVDYYCQSAWRERGVPVVILRQFNCLGERETHPYVITEILSQMYSPLRINEKVEIQLGNNSHRDFLYAGDAVRMAVELLDCAVHRQAFGGTFNLGSEESISIYRLASLVAGLVGVECVITEVKNRCRPWEIWHLQSDNSKLYSLIKSRPEVPLQDALLKTVKYFRDNNYKWVWQ